MATKNTKKSNSKPIQSPLKNFKGKNGKHGFNKHPDNINKIGLNRKTIASVNIELEQKGFIAATPKDIVDCYLRLIGLPLHDLADIVKDDKQPAMIRIVGKAILGGKGFDVIEKMLDRGIGKAIQVEKHEHSGEIKTTMSDEDFEKQLKKATSILKNG